MGLPPPGWMNSSIQHLYDVRSSSICIIVGSDKETKFSLLSLSPNCCIGILVPYKKFRLQFGAFVSHSFRFVCISKWQTFPLGSYKKSRTKLENHLQANKQHSGLNYLELPAMVCSLMSKDKPWKFWSLNSEKPKWVTSQGKPSKSANFMFVCSNDLLTKSKSLQTKSF